MIAYNIRQGENSGTKCTLHQEVSIAYKMSRCVDQSTIVASATAAEPKKFIFGASEVIIGFEIAVAFLAIGCAATFFIPSDLAFGQMGNPPLILDNEDLLIEVEVLSAQTVDTS